MSRPPLIARLRTRLYRVSSTAKVAYLKRVYGMDLGRGIRVSRSAKLDRTNPTGIHVGDFTLISFDAAILTHDFVSNRHLDTYVGKNCFVGARAIVMPGVRIGDHCIIGSGSVVTSDIPANSIAVGNPARVIQSDIVTGRFGIRDPEFLSLEEARNAR